MNMKKNEKIVTCVLAALAVILALFMVLSFVIKNKKLGGVDTSDFSMDKSAYTQALSGSGLIEYPLLQTDFKDVFYLANPDGSAAFYQFNDKKLSEYSGDVKKIDVSVSCSDEDIPASIYYIERDGKVTGFGLFTNVISKANVKIHEYAFFKLTEMPKGYGKNGKLLLVDFEKNNFADDDKIYTEAFSVSLSDAKVTRIVSNNGRTIGSNGAMREDWAMMTDQFLQNCSELPLFISGRNYNLGDVGVRADIIKLNSSGKPSLKVENMLGFWAKSTKYGLAFLRGTDGGFECILNNDGNENSYKTFSGNFYSDYLHNGDYVFSKTDISFTQLLSGDSKKIEKLSFETAPNRLSVSPNEKLAVLASDGKVNPKGANIQSLAICNLSDGTAISFEEPYLYSAQYSSFYWIDDATFIHIRPKNNDGSGFQYVVMTVK